MTPQELVDAINAQVQKVEAGLPNFVCKADLLCVSCAVRRVDGDMVQYFVDDINEKRKVIGEKRLDFTTLELLIQSIENNYVRFSYTAYENYNDK